MKESLFKPQLVAFYFVLISASPLLARPDQANCQMTRMPVSKPVSVKPKHSSGPNFYSVQREIELGKSMADEVDRSSMLIDDPQIIGFITCIGQTLADDIPIRIPLTFRVIDSDVVDALILPGGHIYLNSALILKTENESELAGVIAYCIAHVALRHGTRGATSSQIMQMATIPLILLGPGGWGGHGTYQNMNLAIPLAYLKLVQDQEREADSFGMRYAYNAGYDPDAYVRFFQRILDERATKATAQNAPNLFIRPLSQRVNEQEKTAKALPLHDEDILSSSEFEIVKQRLQEMDSLRKGKENDPTKPTLHKNQDLERN